MCWICGENMTLTDIPRKWFESDLGYATRAGKVQEAERENAHLGKFIFWDKDNSKMFIQLCRDCSLKLAVEMVKLKKATN